MSATEPRLIDVIVKALWDCEIADVLHDDSPALREAAETVLGVLDLDGLMTVKQLRALVAQAAIGAAVQAEPMRDEWKGQLLGDAMWIRGHNALLAHLKSEGSDAAGSHNGTASDAAPDATLPSDPEPSIAERLSDATTWRSRAFYGKARL